MGTFEQDLARAWLGIEIPPALSAGTPQPARRAQLQARLTDQVTWTNLLYLPLKLPLGVVTFAAAMAVVWLTARFLALAIATVVGVNAFWFGGIGGAVVAAIIGLGVGLVGLHRLNLLALGCGRFVRIMLGPSDAALRALESEAVAAREHATAERAEQSRRELIVNVSHELRTPMTSIRGHVESLLMALDEADGAALPPDRLQSHLGIIHREAERLGALIDDLLSLARADASELRLDPRPVAIGEVVGEVHEAPAPLAWRERNITVVQDVAPALPPVVADRDRLAQVLLNLVRNAITHTPAGGLVARGSGSRL